MSRRFRVSNRDVSKQDLDIRIKQLERELEQTAQVADRVIRQQGFVLDKCVGVLKTRRHRLMSWIGRLFGWDEIPAGFYGETDRAKQRVTMMEEVAKERSRNSRIAWLKALAETREARGLPPLSPEDQAALLDTARGFPPSKTDQTLSSDTPK